MNDLFHNQMKALSKIGKLIVNYSEVTGKWYINVDKLEIKRGGLLTSPCEHEDTLPEAVNAYIQQLIGKDIIIDAYGKERTHFAFVPIETNNI